MKYAKQKNNASKNAEEMSWYLYLDICQNMGVFLSFVSFKYLLSLSYYDSVDKLQQESGCSLSKFQVADNIDLFNIVKVYLSLFVTQILLLLYV